MYQRSLLPPSSVSKSKPRNQHEASSKQCEEHVENLIQILVCKVAHSEPTATSRRVTIVGPGKGCICKTGEMEKTKAKYHE
jgi:hypothetical protein